MHRTSPNEAVVATLGDNGTVLLQSSDGTERLWDVQAGMSTRKCPSGSAPEQPISAASASSNAAALLNRHQNAIVDLAFSADGNTLASMSLNSVRSLDATTGRLIHPLSTGPVDTGERVHTDTGNRAPITQVCFSPREDYLVSSCRDGSIHLRPNIHAELESGTMNTP